MNTRIFKVLFLALCITFFTTSCDSTFNELGSDIVGETSYEFGTPVSYKVRAYTKGLGAMDSKNLPVNPLGIYDNPVFGKTKAHFATQVQLAVLNPTFNAALEPEIDSVYLTIPYFSTKTSTDAAGVGTYKLDSIYGPNETDFDLKVYESGYYIRDLDPVNATQSIQPYYTDQNAEFDAVKGILLNDDEADNQNSAFFFSNSEYNELKTSEEGVKSITRKVPALHVKLNKTFFKTKIFEAPAGKLSNNNIFKEYFRGLYFKVDNNGTSAGNMSMMNFKSGTIVISYKQYESVPDNDPVTPLPKKVNKSIILNLAGNTVSLIEQINSPSYTTAISGNEIAGDEKLYVKGGADGTLAILDLFDPTDILGYTNGVLVNTPNNVPDELDELREKYTRKELVVNDASLTFSIDNLAMSAGNPVAYEPNRIYLYDLKNKRPLLDYYTDQYANSLKPKYAKNVHGGIITKNTDGRGTQYKIRITNHLRNLIKYKDSTNVKLGLVVTENIGVVTNKRLKTSFVTSNQTVSEAPTMSVVNMLGTVLYGSNLPVGDPNEDKKLKLTIYYTEPK
ncbi:MAG: hypothetical protein RLZ77_1533 [Bacteroidota bacterium]|jgi:hypothetical protein